MLTINFLFDLLTFIFLLTFLHYFFPFRYSLHQIFLYSFFIVPCAFRNRISLVQNAVFFVLLWTLCNAFYQGGFRGKFFHFSWCCFILLTARAIILLLFTQFLSFSTITPTIEVLLVMILCTQLLSLSFSLVFVHLKNQYRQILLTGCHSLFYIPYILLCFFYIFHMDYGVFYDRATCLAFFISHSSGSSIFGCSSLFLATSVLSTKAHSAATIQFTATMSLSALISSLFFLF